MLRLPTRRFAVDVQVVFLGVVPQNPQGWWGSMSVVKRVVKGQKAPTKTILPSKMGKMVTKKNRKPWKITLYYILVGFLFEDWWSILMFFVFFWGFLWTDEVYQKLVGCNDWWFLVVVTVLLQPCNLKCTSCSAKTLIVSYFSRWWFETFFIFTPTWGNDPIWRAYFSKGLKPPTSFRIILDHKKLYETFHVRRLLLFSHSIISGQFITTCSRRGHPKWWFSKGIPPKMALN